MYNKIMKSSRLGRGGGEGKGGGAEKLYNFG